MATYFRHRIGGQVRFPRKRMLLFAVAFGVTLAVSTGLTASALHFSPFGTIDSNNGALLNGPTNQTFEQSVKTPKVSTDSVSTESVLIRDQNTSTSQAVTSTQLTVNGQEIPVPENGAIHKEISSPESKTTIDISVDNNTTGTTAKTRNNSSVRVYTNSRSTSYIRDKQVNKSSLEVNP